MKVTKYKLYVTVRDEFGNKYEGQTTHQSTWEKRPSAIGEFLQDAQDYILIELNGKFYTNVKIISVEVMNEKVVSPEQD